jgi:hypothetical protein
MLLNTAEAGTVGVVANSTNTGGLSGDAFQVAGTAVPVFSATAKRGSLAYVTPSGSAQGYMYWQFPTARQAVTTQMWIRLGANPLVDSRIMDFRDTTPSTVGGLLINTNGTLRLMQGTSGIGATASPALTLNTWYCVNFWVNNTPTGGTYAIQILNLNGTTFHSYSGTFTSTGVAISQVRFGRPAVVDMQGAFYMDDIRAEENRMTFITEDIVDPGGGGGATAGVYVWNGSTEMPATSVKVWNGTTEVVSTSVTVEGSSTAVPEGYSVYPEAAANFDAGCEAAVKTYLPAATYTFNDFVHLSSGYYGAGLTTCQWLKGAGKTSTIIKMNDNTSTKGDEVAALVLGNTNPYYFLKIGSGSGRGGGPLIKFEDFTLTGTPQGHVYNGLRMDYGAIGSVMRNVKVTGIPGDDSTPPGETFAVNLYDCLNVIVDNCEIDGRLNGTGSTPITASMLGLNNSDHATITDTLFRYCGVGFPIAAWQSTGGDFLRCTFDHNNRVPIHLENCDGVWNFTNCTWTNTSQFHATFATAAVYGSGVATMNFYDPVYDNFGGDGKFWVRVIVGSYARPTVNLYVGGTLRNDLIHFQYY